MNIKKVDDKPMVIHTKEKAKLHIKREPETKIKGRNVLVVEKGSKITGMDTEDSRKAALKVRSARKSSTVNASAKEEVRKSVQKENRIYEALLFCVWHNFIVNAIKFTGQNGCISVELKKGTQGFNFKIADDGIGISDEDKEHLFTPFYSGNRFRNKEGSGLGLSLCKKIVEKLGGTITFESEVGKGSVFIVTIPY